MTAAEIILNIALAIGVSAFVTLGMTLVPNYDRIRFFQGRRSLVGIGVDQRESADRAVELSFAE